MPTRPILAPVKSLALLTLLTVANPSQAIQINASVIWDNDGISINTDDQSALNTGAVDIANTVNDGLGNSIAYHVYGDVDGNFVSGNAGTGHFVNLGQFNALSTFTATGGAVDLSFHIAPGELTLYHPNALLAGEDLIAVYILDILFNNNSIWSSVAMVAEDANGVTFLEDGTSLAGNFSTPTSYGWGDYNNTLSLGSFNPGDLFTIEYNLTTFAGSSQLAADCASLNACNGAISQVGNPFAVGGAINTLAINGATPVPTPDPVPEPEAWLLLSIGLATGLRYALRTPNAHPSANKAILLTA